MTLAFLPVAGVNWLCRTFGERVEPLAPAPGSIDAVWRLASDHSEFGMCDQRGKRLGHYRILNEAPWFMAISPPTTLPRNCVAHDLLAHKGQLIAGGRSNHGEALWVRQLGSAPLWLSIPLPEGVGLRGKAVDALFARDRELVAVDNIMLPKWILVYPLNSALSEGIGGRKFRLATHTTYETIACAAEGREVYALYSRGYNHGITSYFLSLIRKTDFHEVACWSGRREPTTEDLILDVMSQLNMDDEPLEPFRSEPDNLETICAVLKIWKKGQKRAKSNIGGMLGFIKDMAFCGDQLVLALGAQGIAFTQVKSHESSGVPVLKQAAAFHRLASHNLSAVTRLDCPGGQSDGLFAIGTDANGVLSHEWVTPEQMAAVSLNG